MGILSWVILYAVMAAFIPILIPIVFLANISALKGGGRRYRRRRW